MGAAIITGAVSILAIVVSAVVAYLSRNERTLLGQELELLKKIDPKSNTAEKLREVINARVTRWHGKALKKARADKTSARVRQGWPLGSVISFAIAAAGAVVTLVLAANSIYVGKP